MPRPRRLRRLRRRSAGRGQRGRASHLRNGTGCTDRGVSDRPRSGPLRAPAADPVPEATSRRASLRYGPLADRPDGGGRGAHTQLASLGPGMTVTQERKREIVERFGSTVGDTGRTEVQVALLTERIAALTEHLRVHRK